MYKLLKMTNVPYYHGFFFFLWAYKLIFFFSFIYHGNSVQAKERLEAVNDLKSQY